MYRFVVFIILVLSVVSSRTVIDSRFGRVVGGQEVDIEHAPYLVSVRVLGAHRCGGSLLKSNFILTAARCVSGAHLEFIKVVAGSNSRTRGGVSIRAEQVIVHESFNAETHQNDIALVKVNGHFEYSSTVQPVKLAGASAAFREGTKAIITGWGTLNENDYALPDALRSVEVYGSSYAACVNSYAGFKTVVEGMICTSSPIRGRDACEGDAGSPLIVGGVQVGIVSWGYGCARDSFPRVHTDVSYYRTWIQNKLSP